MVIRKHISRESIESAPQPEGMVDRIFLPNHHFEVEQVLYTDKNRTVWGLASLINLDNWGNLVVLAAGPDWFEIPRLHGNFTMQNHGLGQTGELLFLDWRVDGKLTLDEAPSGERRCYICRVADDNTIEWNGDVYFEVP